MQVEQLIQIARAAGEAILEVYAQAGEGQTEVTHKSDDSPLTEADRRAAAIINQRLEALEPDTPIINEETQAKSYEERQHYRRCWMVDPLDGTKEFIKRNGEFTVNIGLIEEGRPVMGVVHAPAIEVTYYGVVAEGKAAKIVDGREEGIEARRFSMDQSGLKVVASRSHLNAETEAFLGKLHQPETTSMGSSLKLLLVAEGTAHLYPRIAPTMEWDTAAAQAVVEAAGGQVLDYHSGQPVRYNKADLRNPYFVVYGKTQQPA